MSSETPFSAPSEQETPPEITPPNSPPDSPTNSPTTGPRSKPVSPGPPEAPMCRICLKPDPILITPCDCRGTFAYSHPHCLNEWLEQTEVDHCDICRFVYIADKRRRGLLDWIRPRFWDYVETVAQFIFSFYACMLGIILYHSVASSATIAKGIVYYLRLCNWLWYGYFSLKVCLYVYKEYGTFAEWRARHFKFSVKNNPQHGVPEAATPPLDLGRPSGIRRRSSSAGSSNSPPQVAQEQPISDSSNVGSSS